MQLVILLVIISIEALLPKCRFNEKSHYPGFPLSRHIELITIYGWSREIRSTCFARPRYRLANFALEFAVCALLALRDRAVVRQRTTGTLHPGVTTWPMSTAVIDLLWRCALVCYYAVLHNFTMNVGQRCWSTVGEAYVSSLGNDHDVTKIYAQGTRKLVK